MNRISAETETIGKVSLVSDQGNWRTLVFKKAEYPTLQKGNMKIVNTDKFNVVCWSIASQATLDLIKKSEKDYTDKYLDYVNHILCFNCENCKSNCYNKRAYRNSTVIVSRMSNFYHTFDKNFVHNMVTMLFNEVEKSKAKNKKLLVRIHVDGEFYSIDYARSWIEICTHFIGNEFIKFYTYTKAYHIIKELEENDEIPPNLVINLSLYDGMKKDLVDYIVNSDNNVFYSSNTMDTLPNKVMAECKGFDCANCGMCATKSKRKIFIHTKIH